MTATAFDDRTPIYRQIADQIRADVLTELLGDDDQVMSTNQYAEFHRINPATAAKAFQELVDEGVLYKRRGVGMFVSPGAADRLRAQRRADFVVRVIDPLVDEARRLGLPIEDVIDAIRDTAAVTNGSSAHPTDQGASQR